MDLEGSPSVRTAAPNADDRGLVVRLAGATPATTPPSVATRSSVADNAADVLLLIANAARLGGGITNDSTAILFVALGTAAATTTDYTAQVVPGGFFSLGNYTGQVRGIWSSDPNTGAARITELT